MYEREIMEQNLAKLLSHDQIYNYQSIGSSQVEEDPVNPFQKRVFEKRLRRSSVASENKHPNTNYHSSVSPDIKKDHKQQIDQIFIETQVEFENIRRKVIEQIEDSESRESSFKSKQIVDNLKETMNYVREYVENNALKTKSHKRNSTFELETYECNFSKSVEENDVQQSQNYYYQRYDAIQTKQEKKEHKVKRRERNLGGSMVSNGKKSIYQSVLEERKLRKNKKKMI